MKSLRLILLAVIAMIVVATCDDDSMKLDKAYLTIEEKDTLRVSVRCGDLLWDGYELSWKNLKLNTNRGQALKPGNNDYEVYLRNGDENSDPIKIDSVSHSSNESLFYVRVSRDDVVKTLDTTQNFLFGIKAANTPVDDIVYQTSYITTICANNKECEEMKMEIPDAARNPISFCYEGSDTSYYHYTFLDKNTTVTLSATAKQGYVFDHWSDNNKENPRDLDVNGNNILKAVFVPARYTINVTKNPPGGGYFGERPKKKEEFQSGDTVTVSTSENIDYFFSGWYIKDKNDKSSRISDMYSYSFEVTPDMANSDDVIELMAVFNEIRGRINTLALHPVNRSHRRTDSGHHHLAKTVQLTSPTERIQHATHTEQNRAGYGIASFGQVGLPDIPHQDIPGDPN